MFARHAAIPALLASLAPAQEPAPSRLPVGATLEIELDAADPPWLDVDPDDDTATPNFARRLELVAGNDGPHTVEVFAPAGYAWLRVLDAGGSTLATSERWGAPRQALTVDLGAGQVAVVEVVSARLAATAEVRWTSGAPPELDAGETWRRWIEDAERRVSARAALLGEAHIDTVRALESLGYLRFATGDHRAALRVYRRAVAGADTLGDPERRAFSRNQLAVQLRKLGDPNEAAEVYAAAMSIAEDAGLAPEILAQSLEGLSAIAKERDDLDTALSLDRRALQLFRSMDTPDPWRIGIAWNNVGVSLGALGRRQEAAVALQNAHAALSRTPNGRFDLASPQTELAAHRFAQGEFGLAAWCAREAIINVAVSRGWEHPSYARLAARNLPILARSPAVEGVDLEAARTVVGLFATRRPNEYLVMALATAARLDPSTASASLATLERTLTMAPSREVPVARLLTMAVAAAAPDARLDHLDRALELAADDPSCAPQRLVALAWRDLELASRDDWNAARIGSSLEALEDDLAAVPAPVAAAIRGRYAPILDLRGDAARAAACRRDAAALALGHLRARIPRGMAADRRWSWLAALRMWIEPSDAVAWAEYGAARAAAETGSPRLAEPPTPARIRAALPDEGAFVDVVETRGTTRFRVVRADDANACLISDAMDLPAALSGASPIWFTWRGPFIASPLVVDAEVRAVADAVHLLDVLAATDPPATDAPTRLVDAHVALETALVALRSATAAEVDLPLAEPIEPVPAVALWRHTGPLGWLFDDVDGAASVETGIEAAWLVDDGFARISAADVMRLDLSGCRRVELRAEPNDRRAAELARALLRAGVATVRVTNGWPEDTAVVAGH